MANAQTTIDLIFNGVDKTSAATLSALNNAEKFSGSLKSITEPIADFTLGAAKLEAGLLGAGLAMTVFAVKTASDFDAAFRQISTIIDASDSDLAGFKVAVLDYAAGSTMPLEQITNALGNAIGSGVDWAESLSLIKNAETLAVATRSDLDSTTKVLVSTLNSYGMKMSEAGHLSDLFFKIIDEGDISMADLSGSFAKVAPIAKAAGVSLEEIGAAIATLTAAGIAPSVAIEGLAGAIGNIVGPSSQARDLAAQLGINFNAAGIKADGLAGLMNKVATATGGNSGQMKVLFGDMNAWITATTLAGPQNEKFTQTLAAMGNVVGATDAAFAKVSGSLDVSGQKIANTFNTLLVAIGTPLLDEFGGMADAVAQIFTALADSTKRGPLSGLVGYIEDMFGDLQSALETVARNLPAALAGADFSGFTGGLDAVVTAMKGLFGNLDLGTVDGLRLAIETVGAAFLGLSKYVGGVIDSFEPLFAALVSVGHGASGVDLSFLEIAGSLGGVVTQLNMALPLFDVLIGVLTVKAGLGLTKELSSLSTLLPVVVAGLGQAGLLGAAAATGYGIGHLLKNPIDSLVSSLTGSETTLGGWIYDLTHAGDAASVTGEKTSRAATGVKQLTTATDGSANSFDKHNQMLLNAYAASERMATSTKKVTVAQTTVAHQTEKAAEAVRKWNEEVAKMAFEEKLKLIDSQTKITTANLEADAKKTVAAYDSLGITLKSTGDLMGTLFGQFKDFGTMDWSSIRKIEAQINKENESRDRALELQTRLTNSTIKQMEAQTDALNRGDGMIRISGDGLEPHLEAFMWQILKKIQTRVNADGLKMLLGT